MPKFYYGDPSVFTPEERAVYDQSNALYKELRQIQESLKTAKGDERNRLQLEEKRTQQKIKAIEESCQHEWRDFSAGGGEFCSICDKWLGVAH